MFPEPLLQQAETLLSICRKKKIRIGTAESCTGGLVAALLTEIAGSSEVVMGGIMSYDNQAKHDVLNVSEVTLRKFGAVSERAANEMAAGAAKILKVDLAVSITGIAGPKGGTDAKPVGTVHFAISAKGALSHQHHVFKGGRHAVRMQAVERAILLLTHAANSLEDQSATN